MPGCSRVLRAVPEPEVHTGTRRRGLKKNQTGQMPLPLLPQEAPKPQPRKKRPSPQQKRIDILEKRVTELEADVARLSYQLEEEEFEEDE